MRDEKAQPCELCASVAGELLWQDDLCRVVLVNDPDYPGFCRVIWAAHIREMTDLSASERRHLMDVVFAVESAVRQILHPDKVNLASLGNLVPHVHWHVIPRYRHDRHFPNPIWGQAQHDVQAEKPDDLAASLRTVLHETLRSHTA